MTGQFKKGFYNGKWKYFYENGNSMKKNTLEEVELKLYTDEKNKSYYACCRKNQIILLIHMMI